MFITGKHIPRRTFLRGAGVTLALPFLESMIPATARGAAAADSKMRFVALFSPHGWAPTYWADNRKERLEGVKIENPEERNAGLGFIHQPFAPWRENVTIVAGLDATSSMPPPGTTGGDHDRAAAVFSGLPPKRTTGADIQCGSSIDQIVAQTHGQETLLPSMQLAIEDPAANTGVCGYGYSCAYSNSISWASPGKPLPHEINPMAVFRRMYGDGSSLEERQSRRQADASILDKVTRKLARFESNLPPDDRHRLDDYLDAVRELERRLQIAEKISAESPSMEVPFGVPESFDEHVKLLFDLQVLAFQGDITRVTSLMIARDISLRSYPESGVKTGNHAASHHGENPQRLEEYAKINRYHSKCIAYFLSKLQAIPEGDATLFDHALIMWGSNMGNSNQHNHTDVGYLLAGGASGRHKAKLNVAAKGPTSNILLTALQIMGVEKESIGDSTGPVSI
ncbi:MAG TPA: DUF1552 domain-containing protein [Bryobacteraceae bacterium]